jgi:hypothetical protein
LPHCRRTPGTFYCFTHLHKVHSNRTEVLPWIITPTHNSRTDVCSSYDFVSRLYNQLWTRQYKTGTVKVHWFTKTFMYCLGPKHAAGASEITKLYINVPTDLFEHFVWYNMFINCNWVVTRWQYTFTHKQYIEQHK